MCVNFKHQSTKTCMFPCNFFIQCLPLQHSCKGFIKLLLHISVELGLDQNELTYTSLAGPDFIGPRDYTYM